MSDIGIKLISSMCSQYSRELQHVESEVRRSVTCVCVCVCVW